ncbi:MAG: signal peptidase I [Chloroflexi bacterium]|nr:signal peptidase I [Chloroflexota bacterium]MBM3174239.1 signal peptidase I [Chloroflexota bacterium]MBM4451016.1 signal peptidase I [Chloroflexota bacterium]
MGKLRLLGAIVFALLIILAMWLGLQAGMKGFKVSDISMLPAIHPGDRIVVNKLAYSFGDIERGDIIVFFSPLYNKDLIKRVTAIPGDRVEVRGGKVYVNGAALEEPYVWQSPGYLMREQTIPADNYFVLGDNRNYSDDSHKGWHVHRGDIAGKAWVVYWPPRRWQLIQHQPSGLGKIDDSPSGAPLLLNSN